LIIPIGDKHGGAGCDDPHVRLCEKPIIYSWAYSIRVADVRSTRVTAFCAIIRGGNQLSRINRKIYPCPAFAQLITQMPFVKPTSAPGDKEFKPLAERVKLHK
jgi:hypothetical protein